jgi:tRNA pseudouridine13 synthase
MNETANITLPIWPFYLGQPGLTGVIRHSPEDFVVEEIPRVEPDGEGSHLWLWVEKRSANTDWVAKELARCVACASRDVGYAGLKDRHAVTRQWFSLPYTDSIGTGLEAANIEGVRVLKCIRHNKKLKRGTLNGNRFELVVRELSEDKVQRDELELRLQQVRDQGVPNYFGPQRFGHGGRNVQQGVDLLTRRARIPRNKRSIYLSAIRSYLFNQVLANRVEQGSWASILTGDLAMLDGTQSVFLCENPDAEIEERCRSLDIHPSGPMPGEKGTQPTGEVFDLEQTVLEKWPQLVSLLHSQRLQASRRSLRLHPSGLQWDMAGSTLTLAFTLPPGAYATTVLRELIEVRETPPFPATK